MKNISSFKYTDLNEPTIKIKLFYDFITFLDEL